MFIQILIVITLITLIVFIYFNKKSLFVNDTDVKYKMSTSDLNYLKRHGKQQQGIPERGIFYTTTKWSAKSNNYFKYKERYYIIEPGYYYKILPGVEFFVTDNINVVFVE